MNKKDLQSSDIISACAIFISLITLFAVLYQTWLLKKQQYASVLPILEVFNSGPTSSEYSLVLLNTGIGPAFIKSMKIHYKDTIYESDPHSFLEKVIFPHDTMEYIYSHVRPGKVIPAGEKVLLLEVSNSERNALKLRKLFGDEIAKLEITYGSVYDEEWRLIGMDDPSVKIE